MDRGRWIEERRGFAAAPNLGAAQAFFIGRPQQIFCAMATLPHFAQRNPAMPYILSMIVAMPCPNPMHIVCRP